MCFYYLIKHTYIYIYIYIERERERSVRGIMVTVVENGHDDPSPNFG